jgi:deoxyribodipyrimidine photo-lyase
MQQRILLWYRQDLRLIDHAPLQMAVNQGAALLPLYCFDDRLFGQTPQGFPKTGAWRAQFLRESVADLRESYRSRGAELIVRCGQPEVLVPQLVSELAITAVYFHTYPTAEEQAVEKAVVANLSIPYQSWWGHTLYQPEDLPFSLTELPELFTKFRKIVEAASPSDVVQVRLAQPAPSQIRPVTGAEPGALPNLADWGLELPTADPRSVLAFQGGETAGLARLNQYFWQQNLLSTYKETRNGLVGADYSSKFSAWLAMGCLSPRYIYAQVQQYEIDCIQNESTYWLIFELLWRDYFALITAKHGNKLFQVAGLRGVKIPWQQDKIRFAQWCNGQTGFPLVDANMRELLATGFMSNRGRQNVASFLTKNLGIDWRWGAEWFESWLIDYDVASNWGNWNYNAGVGNDARGFRFFNIYKQAKDYDPLGEYVKLWLPELAHVPAAKVHHPSLLLPVEQQRWEVRLGVDYPLPVVDLFKSATANEKVYDAAVRSEN